VVDSFGGLMNGVWENLVVELNNGDRTQEKSRLHILPLHPNFHFHKESNPNLNQTHNKLFLILGQTKRVQKYEF